LGRKTIIYFSIPQSEEDLMLNANIKQSPPQMTELVMKAAFGDESLGMPLMGNPQTLDKINTKTLHKFYEDNLCAEKLIISGAGFEHDEFVRNVERKLSQYKIGRKFESYSSIFLRKLPLL
jgi:predicted Zn-dependent peptidase